MVAKTTLADLLRVGCEEAQLQQLRAGGVRPQPDPERPGELVMRRPDAQPLLEQLRGHFGLDEVLVLRRAFAHRLGRGRALPTTAMSAGVRARASHERLRRAVGRVDEADLPLQPGERQHAFLPQRRGELLGRQAVDLMAAVGDEVEDEPELAELFGEPLHLLVAHAGRVPVERRRQVVGQHLVGNSAWIASAKRFASTRSAVLVSIQRRSANGAAASDLAIAYSMPPWTW